MDEEEPEAVCRAESRLADEVELMTKTSGRSEPESAHGEPESGPYRP